jgi:hypothetical protein
MTEYIAVIGLRWQVTPYQLLLHASPASQLVLCFQYEPLVSLYRSTRACSVVVIVTIVNLDLIQSSFCDDDDDWLGGFGKRGCMIDHHTLCCWCTCCDTPTASGSVSGGHRWRCCRGVVVSCFNNCCTMVDTDRMAVVVPT